jgi:hypothetical protein
MKKLIFCLLIVGCHSVDPDNGVSNESYRMACTRARDNIAGINSKLINLKAMDKVHSPEWWDAEIGLAKDTVDLLNATLDGANR